MTVADLLQPVRYDHVPSRPHHLRRVGVFTVVRVRRVDFVREPHSGLPLAPAATPKCGQRQGGEESAAAPRISVLEVVLVMLNGARASLANAASDSRYHPERQPRLIIPRHHPGGPWPVPATPSLRIQFACVAEVDLAPPPNLLGHYPAHLAPHTSTTSIPRPDKVAWVAPDQDPRSHRGVPRIDRTSSSARTRETKTSPTTAIPRVSGSRAPGITRHLPRVPWCSRSTPWDATGPRPTVSASEDRSSRRTVIGSSVAQDASPAPTGKASLRSYKASPLTGQKKTRSARPRDPPSSPERLDRHDHQVPQIRKTKTSSQWSCDRRCRADRPRSRVAVRPGLRATRTSSCPTARSSPAPRPNLDLQDP